MPLLKRKAFEKSTASEFLRDDDEVFHCEITDEIFKDYEEYCERIILVNSMVWTCEMTGKNNLTYAEALESERAAVRSLRDFPMELRIPILYLASLTKRSSFAEMSEDVFNYVRDRYFVGETIEACLEGDLWKDAHVLSVTAPKQQPGSKAILLPSAYCYEVEQFDESDAASAGQIATASHDRVRRRKGVYTRDKNRLFLKQFVQQGSGGVIVIKQATLQKYNIPKVHFDQLFTGDPPEFQPSKKLIKNSISPQTSKLNSSLNRPSPDKKGKQESMDKFVQRTEKTNAGVASVSGEANTTINSNAENLAERMRRAGDLMKQRKIEEKEKKKEKNARLQAYLKEWQKVKEDLDLEDHKIIPIGTPIEIEGIPNEHFGDFLSVLEFIHLYAETLKTKDVFHNGLDVETLRKGLTQKQHTGILTDLVQMLLTTIFSLQEDEADEYNEKGGIAESTGGVVEGDMGVTKAIELANKACKWSQTYLGTPLSKLPLDATTVTEVLRLHLLSSGAEPGSRCAIWRYQQRGGYSCADDAGLRLRVKHPQVIRRLGTAHVADMPIGDKFMILQCLMNQILSYATIRDIVEEKLDTWRTTKHELRLMQIAERKREMEQVTIRQRMKKEAQARKDQMKFNIEKNKVDEELKADFEKMAKESDNKKTDYEKKVKQLQAQCFDHQSYVGMDRAYRRYWLNQCVPGLFVEAGAESVGPCYEKPVPPAPPRGEDVLAYVTTLFEREKAGSDKENESAANSRGNSPKKPLANLNGLTQKLNGLENNIQIMRDLLVCTGNNNTCLVHSRVDRPRWWVYHKEEDIEALIQSLNKRGIRESELRHCLETEKNNIVEYIKKCPVHILNSAVAPPPLPHNTRHKKFQSSILVPPEYTLSEALDHNVRDYILDLEEKVFHGCLGALKVKDRQAWRGTIMVKSYDKQAEYLSWGPNRQYRDDYHFPNGKLKVPQGVQDKGDVEIQTLPENKYRDPGFYLGDGPKINGLKIEPKEKNEVQNEPPQDVVRDLASALLQISQSIHQKYLKRPLGLDDKERKERESRGKPMEFDALERWEVSLMECKSFAQIALHLFTLDSSITWSASILNASCRLCRRKADPDNMLLCDGCNKGHHLYCLKPKLTKVPDGDWFCDQCKPKERTPRKRRKLFSDEDIEEPMDISNEDSEAESVGLGLCAACGSGGRLAATCMVCTQQWHAECALPKPSRAHARTWTCAGCLAPGRDSDDSEDNTALQKLKGRKPRTSKETAPVANGFVNGHRSLKRGRKSKEELRRKSRASSTKSIQGSGESDEDAALVQFKVRGTRPSLSPIVNGTNSKRKSKGEIAGRKSRTSEQSLDISGKGRKRNRFEELVHIEALDRLLADVMKHKDGWPFCEPVDTEMVPDYLNVIDTPMDLSTMRAKLAAGQYSTDEEFMNDAQLIFVNCYTYNKDTHPVARAGVRLEKYFQKRCNELDLMCLPDINVEEDRQAKPTDGGQNKAKRPRVAK